MTDITGKDTAREDPTAAELANAGESRAKRPYLTPQLVSYGDIREITQLTAAGPPNQADGQMDGFVTKRTNGGA